MRLLRLFLVVFLTATLLAPISAEAAKKKHRSHGKRASAAAWGVNDARYAAIVINPETGEIYHEKNADARRYPASLTKMMTLYLLFEALENKTVTLGTHLKVSDYATTQPQTNLALSEGDEIPVDTAIKALVVRSANDVAVVVAEALGGDVDHFAEMMTAKARALGMRNTVFLNPNGLPNSGQYTTARDMAKLGIALRRDFPRYYPYFSVKQFSWAGTSYYTHNRVLLRYAGVDGIKTGFIGASGFNLVTSCKRGGRPLVGVVMGGASWAWRDNRMIELLDQTYKTIASRGAARGAAPTPANLPPAKGAAADDAANNDDADDAKPAAAAAPAPTAPAIAKPTAPAVATPPVPPAPASVAAPSAAAKPTPFAVAKPATPTAAAVTPPPAAAAVVPDDTSWSIQVGAFSTKPLASSAAQQAYRLAFTHLKGAQVAVLPPDASNAGVYRARLQHISESQATKACAMLAANHAPCLTYRSDAR